MSGYRDLGQIRTNRNRRLGEDPSEEMIGWMEHTIPHQPLCKADGVWRQVQKAEGEEHGGL